MGNKRPSTSQWQKWKFKGGTKNSEIRDSVTVMCNAKTTDVVCVSV